MEKGNKRKRELQNALKMLAIEKGYATFILYRIMSRTVLGTLMVADHARNGVTENKYIDTEFEKFRTLLPGKLMPAWDSIRVYLDNCG